MSLVNYFLVRWAEGYSHVSAAGSDLVIALEQTTSVISGGGDHAMLAVRQVRVGDQTVPVALLRLDVIVSASPRRLQYAHAVVLPAEYRNLPIETWRRVLERKYGADVEERIHEVYERIAITSKADGRALLTPFEIDLADLRAEAAPEAAPVSDAGATVAPAGPAAGAGAGTIDKAGPPLPLAGPGPSRLVPALIAAAGIAIALVTYQCGRSAGTDDGAAALREIRADLTARRDELARAQAALTAAEQKLTGVPVDLRECAEQKESLRNDIEICKSARTTVEQRNGKLEAEVAALTGERNQLASAKTRLENDKELLEGQKTAAIKRATDAEAKLESEKRTIEQRYKSKIEQMNRDVDNRDAWVKYYRHWLQTLCGKVVPEPRPPCGEFH